MVRYERHHVLCRLTERDVIYVRAEDQIDVRNSHFATFITANERTRSPNIYVELIVSWSHCGAVPLWMQDSGQSARRRQDDGRLRTMCVERAATLLITT